MVQINWTFQSKADLKDIADYISKDSKRYAKLQVSKIIQRTQILKLHIYSGKLVQEINRNEIRELIEGNYRIIYKVISDKKVNILTVHHSARDFIRRIL